VTAVDRRSSTHGIAVDPHVLGPCVPRGTDRTLARRRERTRPGRDVGHEGYERVADREELRELRARYSHYWDEQRADEFVELFTEDAVVQMGADSGVAHGRDELRRMVHEYIGFIDFAVHFTTDELTTFTGETTAEGVCRFAFHGGRTPNIQGAGRYEDVYRKTPVGWRFVSRAIRFFYMGERQGSWPETPAAAILTRTGEQ
jgi:ketosteroid isomerase-like protein